MTDRYQITRSADLESLSAFRDLIDDACKDRSHIDDNACYDLKLAVDEAATNIITHGYAGMNSSSIILNLEINSHKVVVKISDFGHAFEPSEGAAPDVEAGLEDRPMGGFGPFFIYQTMDEINYEITESGNQLIFIKKLPE